MHEYICRCGARKRIRNVNFTAITEILRLSSANGHILVHIYVILLSKSLARSLDNTDSCKVYGIYDGIWIKSTCTAHTHIHTFCHVLLKRCSDSPCHYTHDAAQKIHILNCECLRCMLHTWTKRNVSGRVLVWFYYHYSMF